ncbi:MAG: hypothetical protein WBF33_07115 [Candidatus Nitrosopolaris sp.]|jgi:hypothetical protein
MMIKINLVLVVIAIFMLGVMPSHTQDYLKGHKLGKEDGKTGTGMQNEQSRIHSLAAYEAKYFMSPCCGGHT